MSNVLTNNNLIAHEKALEAAGVAITQKGRLLLRSIAMVFDRHIDQAENDNRFSKAI